MSRILSTAALDDGTSLFELTQAFSAREEKDLKTTLIALRGVRDLLARGNADTNNAALQHTVTTVAAAITDVTRQRDAFRNVVAETLGVNPRAVTLRLIAERLPPPQNRIIHQHREHLRELAVEMDRLNSANAVVVWWCVDFVRHVFSQVQRQPVGSRYSSSGKVQAAPCGPTWQGQG